MPEAEAEAETEFAAASAHQEQRAHRRIIVAARAHQKQWSFGGSSSPPTRDYRRIDLAAHTVSLGLVVNQPNGEWVVVARAGTSTSKLGRR